MSKADGNKADAGPGDESLLALIDKLAGLLERTELNELEVQVGSTGLVLRKPSALGSEAPAAMAAVSAGSAAPTWSPSRRWPAWRSSTS